MTMFSHHNTSSTHVALHLLINQLAMSVQPASIERGNTLVNDIAPCLLVRTNASRLGLVIRELLETVNSNSEKSAIHLSARIFGDVLLFHIRKKCMQQSSDFTECLVPLKKMAEQFYGEVSVTSQRSDVTTLALGFINQPIAA